MAAIILAAHDLKARFPHLRHHQHRRRPAAGAYRPLGKAGQAY
jgi:hypothetical protein